MEHTKDLSPARAILTAAQLASSSDIRGLDVFTAARADILQTELVLRILLTFLPETLDPSSYVQLLKNITTEEAPEPAEEAQVNVASVAALTEQQATSRASKLHLVKLHDSEARYKAIQDPLTLFLIHRAHRIDKKTGLLALIPSLIKPFVARSEYLRRWYISTVVPLIRRDLEYYPKTDSIASLKSFEKLSGAEGIEELLKDAAQQQDAHAAAARDLRSIVGPWAYGSSQRNKTNGKTSSADDAVGATVEEWQNVFAWLVQRAITDISLAADTFANWDGPDDVDLDDLEDPKERQQEATAAMHHFLRSKYCQLGLASVYASDDDTPDALEHANRILYRVADLCGLERPSPLTLDPVILPTYERIPLPLNELPKTCLLFEKLLDADQILTIVSDETFALLQLFLHSANVLRSLSHPVSIAKVAKLRLWSDESEQLRLLQKLMHGVNMGVKKDEAEWLRVRSVLLWLRSWAISDGASEGHGILGRLSVQTIEREMLTALCSGAQYQLAARVYLGSSPAPLARDEVEKIVVDIILNFYDNASNGNKTRGGVKKAAEVLAAFRSPLKSSPLLDRCNALIAATHALSFYSLTLIPGTPLQPRSIREHGDPVSLIAKVLEQNPNSYTKLDDYVQIGRNLVIALDGDPSFSSTERTSEAVEAARASRTERRVIGLAVEAALAENDFETAYSYVVNRLPSPGLIDSADATSDLDSDDISWRAAFHAGRHRGAASNKRTSMSSPEVRRLEQRMELLSTAMLLAPSSALPEILAAWRRCEEELLTLLALETTAENEFDDRADAGEVRLPGAFAAGGEPTFMVQPKRKEIGRGAAEEAPMGLFEVARGAAAAFSRSTGGAASRSKPSSQHQPQNSVSSVTDESDGRTRRRDIVANALTGSLVSGVGWVLGAKPAGQE